VKTGVSHRRLFSPTDFTDNTDFLAFGFGGNVMKGLPQISQITQIFGLRLRRYTYEKYLCKSVRSVGEKTATRKGSHRFHR